MHRVHPFTVIAELPDSLKPLRQIAHNLWWSWHHNAKGLFTRISRDGWLRAQRNPVRLLNSLSLEEIQNLARDQGLVSQIGEIKEDFERYLKTRFWWKNTANESANLKVAYFSAEFGLHECLPIYSGGLGVLAGDHLKAASDLGVPITAVGLLYYEGYFSQYLNADGWQQEIYPQVSVNRLPISPLIMPDGKQLQVVVDIRGSAVTVKAWEAQVGLTRLLLLDTNFDENDAQFRPITSRLYGGDVNFRIAQEIVLGIGGLRVLGALGIDPDVCHMNEGHSAFLAFEQIRRFRKEKNFDFEQAVLAIRQGNLFTTHTMVPAGHDVFALDLMDRYFRGYAQEMGVDFESLLRLGRVNQDDHGEAFSMSVLAVRCSQGINAVSELHGSVSRKLWQNLWPSLPLDENPISHITNGIHTSTWTSRDMAELYDRYLGPAWRDDAASPKSWEGIQDIPDEELWREIGRGRSVLVSFCRERLRDQLTRRGAGRVEIEAAKQVLDPDALTIGFARRFATYKRSALILSDVERLIQIVSNNDRPVQLIFAGKAHPADQPGKDLIARIVHAARRPELKSRLLFLENYDMSIARKLVQGVDVWLNTPRRPLEASGTSGMKVAVNAGLNLSVLDGWWCEAFNGENGWSIGQGEEYEDQAYQDQIESRSLYDLLEREVIPTFYNTSPNGLPHKWIQMVKNSMMSIAPRFSAARMVSDYATHYYLPLGNQHRAAMRDEYRSIVAAHGELTKFRKHWNEIRILNVETNGHEQLPLGQSLPIRVTAQLGHFSPNEIAVEVRYGTMDATHHLLKSSTVRLTNAAQLSDSNYVFDGQLSVRRAGSYGFSVRLVPIIDGAAQSQIPGLITWWG